MGKGKDKKKRKKEKKLKEEQELLAAAATPSENESAPAEEGPHKISKKEFEKEMEKLQVELVATSKPAGTCIARITLDGGQYSVLFATSVSGICRRSAARNRISLITLGQASASPQIRIGYLLRRKVSR